MEYVYSSAYGVDDRNGRRKKVKDKFGDDIPWQVEYDRRVDKGLMQVYREDSLPFTKLIAVLRQEMYRAMHSEDRWKLPAYQLLDKYQGPCYACKDGTGMKEAVRWYWYDHLGVEREV